MTELQRAIVEALRLNPGIGLHAIAWHIHGNDATERTISHIGIALTKLQFAMVTKNSGSGFSLRESWIASEARRIAQEPRTPQTLPSGQDPH